MAIVLPERDAVIAARHESALTSTQPVRVVGRGRHSREALARQAARRASDGSRLPALDGLRGVAALVVVVHHILLTQPALADPYRDPGAEPVGSLVWWLTYTPAHLVWAGTEAVYVFFVLSGLVLTLPAVTGRLHFSSFYPARATRLYPPVAAAVLFAVVLSLVVPPVWGAGSSWWMAAETHPVSVLGVLADLTLVADAGATNHVLWSLQWEVAFSALLPVFVLVAASRRVAWSAKVAAALGAVAAAAALDSIALSSLALFLLGSLMATGRAHIDYATAVVEGQRRPSLCWAGIGAGTALLLCSYWLVYAPGWELPPTHPLVAAARAAQAFGACCVVVIAWHCPGARALLESRAVRWLGVRSFSLYLIHLPIVTTAALLMGGTPPLAVELAVALPLALLATAVFHRLVERPVHQLSRRVGRRFARAA